MKRLPDSSVKREEYSHKQVQNIAPFLCLTENAAIREILKWVSNDIYDDFTYKSMVYLVQSNCNFLFKNIENEHHVRKIIEEEYPKLKLSDKQFKKIKEEYERTHYIPLASKEKYKKYSKSVEYTEEDLLKIKFQINCKILKNSLGESETKYYLNTNYVKIYGEHADFINKWARSISGTDIDTSINVIKYNYGILKNMKIKSKPSPIYEKINNKIIMDDDAFGKNIKTFYANTNAIYEFDVLTFMKNSIYICVHFLYKCSLNFLMNSALTCLQHKHTEERKIIINNPIEGVPYLFKLFKLKKRQSTLTINNPNYLEKSTREAIYSSLGLKSSLNYCNSRGNGEVKYDYNLEEKIFEDHLVMCGYKRGDKMNKAFFPSFIHQAIKSLHKEDPYLSTLNHYNYPHDTLNDIKEQIRNSKIAEMKEIRELELLDDDIKSNESKIENEQLKKITKTKIKKKTITRKRKRNNNIKSQIINKKMLKNNKKTKIIKERPMPDAKTYNIY
jgi:hypothetical protein